MIQFVAAIIVVISLAFWIVAFPGLRLFDALRRLRGWYIDWFG